MGTDGGSKEGTVTDERKNERCRERKSRRRRWKGIKWLMDNRKKEFGKKEGWGKLLRSTHSASCREKRDEEEQMRKARHSPVALFLQLWRCKSTALAERGRKTDKPQQNVYIILWMSAQRKKKAREKTKNIRQRYQRSSSVRAARRISPGHMHKCKTTC